MFVRIKDVQRDYILYMKNRPGFLMIELFIGMGVMIVAAILLVNHHAYRSLLHRQFLQRMMIVDECKDCLQAMQLGVTKNVSKACTLQTISVPVCVRNFRGESKVLERFRWIQFSFPWPSTQQLSTITMIGGYDTHAAAGK